MTVTDVEVEMDIDLDKPVPCEALIPTMVEAGRTCEYNNPADYIVKCLPCPNCGALDVERYACCHQCWVDMTQNGECVCSICGKFDLSGKNIIIVEVLKS